MTLAVKMTSHRLVYGDGSSVHAVAHVIEGKKKVVLNDFSQNPEFETHIWQGRNIIIEEVIVPAPEAKNKED